MGVDRTSDFMFSLINSDNSVFDGTDALWENIQKNIIQWLIQKGGQAENYTPNIQLHLQNMKR